MSKTWQSPYKKYDKKPHVYSPTYQLWRQALAKGSTERAEELTKQHQLQFLGHIVEPVIIAPDFSDDLEDSNWLSIIGELRT